MYRTSGVTELKSEKIGTREVISRRAKQKYADKKPITIEYYRNRRITRCPFAHQENVPISVALI
jgi:hypothetical protein